jgi:hypothetical protein
VVITFSQLSTQSLDGSNGKETTTDGIWLTDSQPTTKQTTKMPHALVTELLPCSYIQTRTTTLLLITMST